MKGILKTVGKMVVGLSFGVGVGIAAWFGGVCYGAAGTVAADDEARALIDESSHNLNEAVRSLGEACS